MPCFFQLRSAVYTQAWHSYNTAQVAANANLDRCLSNQYQRVSAMLTLLERPTRHTCEPFADLIVASAAPYGQQT